MWIKGLTEAMISMLHRFGVHMVIESVSGDGIVFRLRKGHFKKMVGFPFEDVMMANDKYIEHMLETLEHNAKEIADAYDCTNKSKAWNETLQDIGVREG